MSPPADPNRQCLYCTCGRPLRPPAIPSTDLASHASDHTPTLHANSPFTIAGSKCSRLKPFALQSQGRKSNQVRNPSVRLPVEVRVDCLCIRSKSKIRGGIKRTVGRSSRKEIKDSTAFLKTHTSRKTRVSPDMGGLERVNCARVVKSTNSPGKRQAF